MELAGHGVVSEAEFMDELPCRASSFFFIMFAPPASRRAVLVNMPFGGIRFPSIQLGLLQAIAKAAGIKVSGLYANMDFASRIGFRLYDALAQHRGVLIGEWLFTRTAFPEHSLAEEFPHRFSEVLRDAAESAATSEKELLAIRNETAPRFISDLTDRIVHEGAQIVGFSSTFEQNVASLALARSLKKRNPDIVTLFGGANFDGLMGPAYMRAFPWIDIAVVGEADTAFPALLRAILDGMEVPKLPGILTRERLGSAETIGRATYEGPMDALPVPNYDSYFDAAERYGFQHEEIGRPLYLPIETSRGCWWGEKHHCTFCGLNALGMVFRAKKPETVIREISQLADRYRIHRFSVVDNILSLKHLGSLLSDLVDGEYDYKFFYEVKSNLTREAIQRFRNAGVTHVQPGIESFNSHILKLMKKGIKGIQNVNTLRWLRYYGIETLWNVLLGFPGETLEDYRAQEEIIRRIHHLPPPHAAVRIWLERFSPYFSDAADYGFTNMRPEPSYAYVYPDSLYLDDAAYFFMAESERTLSDIDFKPTIQAVTAWKHKWDNRQKPPYLHFLKFHSGIRIYDGRDDPRHPSIHFFKKPISDIYLYCSDRPRTLSYVVKMLEEAHEATLDEGRAQRTLERFVESGLMITEDGSYLSLAIPQYYCL